MALYAISLIITVVIILRNILLNSKSFSYKEVGIIAICIAIVAFYGLPQTQDTIYDEVDVIKTVAHIDLTNRTDLQLIGNDIENDVAIYKYVKPEYDIEIGDTVYLVGGATATVVSFDAAGFTIDSNSITAGMSGTAVCTDNKVQIGIISSRMNDGYYRCVWS